MTTKSSELTRLFSAVTTKLRVNCADQQTVCEYVLTVCSARAKTQRYNLSLLMVVISRLIQ